MKSEDVGLIVRTISFQDFQPMWSWSTNVTDRQTDDMRSQDHALHYSASRGKNEMTASNSLLGLAYSNVGLMVTCSTTITNPIHVVQDRLTE